MKTSIIFSDNTKQIVLTPETESEKTAMSMFTESDNIDIALREGDIYSCQTNRPFTGQFSECRRKYLRFFDDDKSIILVLTPKKEQKSIYSIEQMNEAFNAGRAKQNNKKYKHISLLHYLESK